MTSNISRKPVSDREWVMWWASHGICYDDPMEAPTCAEIDKHGYVIWFGQAKT